MNASFREALLSFSFRHKPAALRRLALVLPVSLAFFVSQETLGQDRQRLAFSLPPGSIQYLQEQTIEVGDVPGHILRIFEGRIDYQRVNLAFGGVRVKEGFTRGFSDYINGNGTSSNYSVYLLEDGNKVFSKDFGVGQTAATAEGGKTFKSVSVLTFTGGTGKFRGIKGQLRGNVVRLPGDSVAKADVSGEYWIEE